MAESYKSASDGSRAGSPPQQRELRAQGKRTMQRLLDAGLEVFSTRGYHATRVDDIVRVARTSHGTFYLYFANKEALIEALAKRCADEVVDLVDDLPALDTGSRDELRRWLADFVSLYRRHGPVIRAWSERQVSDRNLARLGRRSFGRIATALAERLPPGDHDPELRAAALLALIERFTYVVTSRDLGWDDDVVLDTLAGVVHRGFVASAA